MRKNPIYGLTFRPSAQTVEKHEEIFQSSDYSVKTDFYKNYSNHIAAMQIVAGCAKHYILNNYEKVIDWSDLNVIIEDNSKQPTEYFKYKPRKRLRLVKDVSSVVEKTFNRLDEEDKLRHNPIITLTDVVLDSMDGDFSLTINSKDHNWISDDSVIIIAEYIEKQLKK